MRRLWGPLSFSASNAWNMLWAQLRPTPYRMKPPNKANSNAPARVNPFAIENVMAMMPAVVAAARGAVQIHAVDPKADAKSV